MKRYLPIAGALLIGVLIGALLFRGGVPGKHDHDAATSGGDMNSTAKEIWTCSMHPQIQAPKPGLCPICAMELIPLSRAGAIGEGREYSMSDAAKVLAGINTTVVERAFPEAEVRLYGTVAYDETRQKIIAARFPGRIERLFVDYTGIRVNEGDHLATIYSPDLLAAQTELLTAKQYKNEGALRIARDKLRLWGFPDKRINEIESSGATLDQLMIDAPASGIVTHKNISEGEYVQTGMNLFTIDRLDELWIMFDAYESDKPWLRFGQTVQFTAEAIPGREFEGRISFLSPSLNPKTRTFAVRVNLNNAESLLQPGMFVRGVVKAKIAGAGRVIDPSLAGKWISPMHPEVVRDGPGKCDVCGMDLVPAEELGYTVATPEGKGPLLVSASAVLNTGKRSVVYVEKTDAEEPTFEGREVLLGTRAGDVYLVEAGLKEGERVVTEGAFAIDSALQIQARPSMMLPGDDQAPLFQQFEVENEFLSQVDAIVEAYFALQLALAGDDLPKSKASATALSNSLEIEIDSLSQEAADAYRTVRGQLADSLKSLQEAEDIKAARVPFEPASHSVDELVRRFGTHKLPVYVAHCPMAFSNRGANWLQGNEDLLNPYFGDAMLRCGEIKEQIAGATKQKKSEPVPEPAGKTKPHAGHKH